VVWTDISRQGGGLRDLANVGDYKGGKRSPFFERIRRLLEKILQNLKKKKKVKKAQKGTIRTWSEENS